MTALFAQGRCCFLATPRLSLPRHKHIFEASIKAQTKVPRNALACKVEISSQFFIGLARFATNSSKKEPSSKIPKMAFVGSESKPERW